LDRKECEGLLRSALDRLKDAHNPALSFASRFGLAYNAAHAHAHALALTALRRQGYHSDKRYLVFQCLVHTIDASKARVRMFALCHERRNLAEYEGYMDVDDALLTDLLAATDDLMAQVQKAMADAE
jgi:hypothetical protein